MKKTPKEECRQSGTDIRDCDGFFSADLDLLFVVRQKRKRLETVTGYLAHEY